MQNKKKKENLVILLGFVFIILVFIITFIRPSFKKEESFQDDLMIQGNKFKESTISSRELKDILSENDNILILDIRLKNDYLRNHIIDSTNISLDFLREGLKEFSRNKKIVVVGYDQDQEGLTEAMNILEEAGFEDAVVLIGSINSWSAEKNQVVSGGDPASFLDQSKVTYLSPEKFDRLIQGGYQPFILDIRSAQLFSREHIPNAINIPLGDLEKRRGELPFAKEIVIYGDAELEGFQAGVRLFDMNYLMISVLEGGFLKWKNQEPEKKEAQTE